MLILYMQTISIGKPEDRAGLYRMAYALAMITVGYNLVEGLVSVFFGLCRPLRYLGGAYALPGGRRIP